MNEQLLFSILTNMINTQLQSRLSCYAVLGRMFLVTKSIVLLRIFFIPDADIETIASLAMSYILDLHIGL